MNTRKYPRTLNEAFGPYHDRSPIYDADDRMNAGELAMVIFCCACFAAVLVIGFMGMLPGA